MHHVFALVRCWVAGCLLIALLPAATTAAADDVVQLKAVGDNPAAAPLRGRVVDFTGRELHIEIEGRQRTVPSALVASVETTRSPEHLTGDRLLAAGDFRAAAARYQAALQASRENRDWVRREIMAGLVRAEHSSGRLDRAGEYFLILLANDPATPYFESLPLVWTEEPPAADIERKAQAWLMAPEPAAALMGASVLLATSQRAAALDVLRQLLADSDPRIAWLAYGQLWRAGAANSTAEQRQTLQRRLEESDPSLRAGAYFVLARALWVADDPEQAALVWMRVPILYEREYLLAAASLVEAAQCLEKLQRTDPAVRLYRELVDRFPAAPAAATARTRLERLGVPMAAGDN